MNEHRGVEVAVREHLRDVLEVAANLITAFGISNVIRANIDNAAVIVELEMMGRLLMRKPHDVVPVLVYHCLVILRDHQGCADKYKRDCANHKLKLSPIVEMDERRRVSF